MLYFAISLFVLAALFGLILLNAVLRNKRTPKPVVLLHGLFAVFAILILIMFIINNHGAGPITSLIIFVLAAMGGLYMFSHDMLKKSFPKAVAIIHPLAALVGLIMLIFYVLK